MKQAVSPGVIVAAIVGVIVVIGVIVWVVRSRNPPLAPGNPSMAAPEANIPRPGMTPRGPR